MAASTPPFSDTPDGFERYKYTRERLSQETKYRRDRQWNVFVWIAGLFLAIIGGVIAIHSNGHALAYSHRISLTAAVFAFLIFGAIRIRHDASVARFYSDKCFEFDSIFNLQFDDRPSKKRHVGHRVFLLILAAAAVGVIWWQD